MIPVSHIDIAELCRRAYADRTYVVSEVEVLEADLGDYIILAVCGTELVKPKLSKLNPKNWSWRGFLDSLSNLRDIVRDLRFYRMQTPYGRAHRGFYLGARRWVRKFADQLPDKPIIISGHSKGAAEAGHIAEMLFDFGKAIREVVLFGEPASRSRTSRNRYKSLGIPTTSYINLGDFIRFTPPWDHPITPRTLLPGPAVPGHNLQRYITNLETIYEDLSKDEFDSMWRSSSTR